MPSAFDAIKNGFATAQHVVTDWLMDNRPSNTDRPRVSGQDPTAAIDKSESVGILNFPSDRPKYYITFGFEEYRRPNQFTGLESSGVTDYICLPMPNNLQDNNQLDYAPMSGSIIMEALTQVGRDFNGGAASSIATGSVDPLVKSSGSITKTVSGLAAGASVRTLIGAAKSLEDTFGPKLGKNDQSLVRGIMQMGGMADNPFNTVAFGGPNFKQHHFAWRLSPKSQAESDAVKKICDTFKKAAYPELLTMAAGGFFKYPNIVWPKFQPDKAKSYLYEFKPCVITSININFTPVDRPGFFAVSEAPVEVYLELNLLEIEIWRNGDEKSIANHQVPTIYSKDFANVTGAPLSVRDVP